MILHVWVDVGALSQSRAKYLSVAKQMKAYEDHLYEQWRENVEAILPALLKRNLLIKPHDKLAQQGGQVIQQELLAQEHEKHEVEAGVCNQWTSPLYC